MDNYTKLWIGMDADELQTWEREVTRRLEDAKTEVTTQEQALAAIRTELARRKLAAFWQANEGLRLEVGDALLVTEEVIAEISSEKRNWGIYSIRAFKTSPKFSVYHINPDKVAITIQFNESSQTVIPLDIARRMRLAYLQAHGEAQP